MKKKIEILGSTGSIGKTTFNIIKNNPNDFEILLLTTNKNVNTILKQAKMLKVKNVLVSSHKHYLNLKNKLKNNKIKVHNNLDDLQSIIKKKVDYTMCAISGLSGLKPTIDAIKFSTRMGTIKMIFCSSGGPKVGQISANWIIKLINCYL